VRGKVTLYAKRYPLYAIKVASNERRATSNESGVAAIALVVMVIIILLTLMGGLVLLTTTGYKSYHFSKDRAQALYLAEAGISQALQEIRDKEDGLIPETPLTYSDGSLAGLYSVECLSSGDPTYTLTSYGYVNKDSTNEVKRTVSAKYREEGIEEFKHIASYKSSCSQCLIDLGAYETSNIPIPDMEFFRNNADYIYTSGFTSNKNDNLNGIYYVQGDAKLSQGTILDGTIVVDGGKLTVERQCEIDPSENPDASDFPAIVVYGGTGNVTIKRETKINGLIYASNSVTTHNNPEIEIEGVIIADEITVWENNKIEYKEVSPPGFAGGTPAVSLVPGSWQST